MKITYLHHSGFVVTEGAEALVFDYWRDAEDGYLHKNVLPYVSRLYVFASHFHADHFNAEVLTWQTSCDVIYVFGKDILRRRRASESDAYYLAKGAVFEDDSVSVQAFGSTDSGVSFGVQWRGYKLFHAGDLNNWHWSDESRVKEAEQAEKRFLGELKDIHRLQSDAFDVAFFPVDARIGRDYDRGIRQFVDLLKPHMVVPMHFTANGFESLLSVKAAIEAVGSRYWLIQSEGETLELIRSENADGL